MAAPTFVKRVELARLLTKSEVDANFQNMSDGVVIADNKAIAANNLAATKASQTSVDALAASLSTSQLPVTTIYSSAIPFDGYRTMGVKQVDAAITFTKNLVGATTGAETVLSLIADGVNLPSFAGFTLAGSQGYDNTLGRINEISFFKTASGYYYGVLVGGTLDIVAPLESTATVQNAAPSVIEVLFDEDLDKSVAPPDPACFAVSAGHALTISAWGTGNRMVNLTTSAAFVNGEAARTLSYTKNGTRNLKDLTGNEVVNFAGKPITNSVLPVDSTAPTLVSATVSNSTPSQIDLVWSEPMNATMSAPAAFAVSAGHVLTAHTYVDSTHSYLTTSTAFVSGEGARTLAYTQPGSNKMQDLAGNLLVNIASAAITNNTLGAGRADNFNRADQTGLGTPSDGGSTYVDLSANAYRANISGNKAVIPSGYQNIREALVHSSGDAVISCAFVTGSGGVVGIIFRGVDNQNMLRFRYTHNTTTFTVEKQFGGSNTFLATDVVASYPSPTLSVELVGTSVVCKANGTTIFNVTEASFTAAVRHGFILEGTNVGNQSADNLTVV